MKLYAVTSKVVDPKLKAAWDQYAQRMGIGDKPKVSIRVTQTSVTSERPTSGSYKRWKPRKG